jgi:pimeloyl-ACP methyl ester carboxylesterase
MSTTSRSPASSGTGEHTQEIIDAHDRMLAATAVRRTHVTVGRGRQVHVVLAGNGPPAVFLHGMNTSSLGWTPLIQHLGDVTMIAVDRPGRGLSDSSPPTTTAGVRSAAVGFVDGVLSGLGLERPVLVGQSGGGIWALWYVLAHPERVGGLILLGSTPLLPGTQAPAPLRLAATPVVGDLLSRVVKPSPKTLVRLLSSVGEGETILRYPDLLQALVSGGKDPTAVAADRAELKAVVTPLGFRRSMRFRVEELREVAVPTLVIWGDRDSVGSVAVARNAASLIPDSHLEVLPAGHVPQFGCPDRVADLVSEFVHARARRGMTT